MLLSVPSLPLFLQHLRPLDNITDKSTASHPRRLAWEVSSSNSKHEGYEDSREFEDVSRVNIWKNMIGTSRPIFHHAFRPIQSFKRSSKVFQKVW